MSWEEARELAEASVHAMGLCDKHLLMQGVGWQNFSGMKTGYYVGTTYGNPDLGIPSLNMNDAAGGFRTYWEGEVGTVTAWPSLLSVAATWDSDRVEEFGEALGEEFVGKGANAILGPSVNVHRVARGGRNFEYMSGEDPYLGSKLTTAYVKGVQSRGVMTTVKHWVLNNQETNRNTMSANADRLTKEELYYPPFKAAVLANTSATMCSYNRIDGIHSCANGEEMNGILKGEWGYQGFVMSDWWALHGSTLTAGVDQEMPGWPTANYFNASVLKQTNQSAVDEAATRILTSMFRLHLPDRTRCWVPHCASLEYANVTSPAHTALARTLAAESVVLLKNAHETLPLTATGLQTLAVIGTPAVAQPYNTALPGAVWNQGDYYSGGGSGHVTAFNITTPLQAIKNRAAELGIAVTYTNDVSVAAQADVTIVFGATTSGEAADRPNLTLDDNADELIRQVAAVASRTVVLLQIPGVTLMPWHESVAAIAVMFLGGQETGGAWADVIFGDRAPVGRLPVGIPTSAASTIEPSLDLDVNYSEGLSTSYRNPDFSFDFPFGFGLTYTTFQWKNVYAFFCDGVNLPFCVNVTVHNNGDVASRDVVQLYVELPQAPHPVTVLKDFVKTPVIAPAGSATVQLQLGSDQLSFWNQTTNAWQLAKKFWCHLTTSSSPGDYLYTFTRSTPASSSSVGRVLTV